MNSTVISKKRKRELNHESVLADVRSRTLRVGPHAVGQMTHAVETHCGQRGGGNEGGERVLVTAEAVDSCEGRLGMFSPASIHPPSDNSDFFLQKIPLCLCP